jgi:hypothetical protein
VKTLQHSSSTACKDPSIGHLFLDYWLDDIGKVDRQRVERHLRECRCCRIEFQTFALAWSSLPKTRPRRGRLSPPAPKRPRSGTK